MRDLLQYHARIYFKSNKIIMPFLFWVIFLRISYSQKPLEYIPNIVMSAGVLFFVVTWVGFTYMDLEDAISEQLIILKVRSMNKYNASKLLFLMEVGVAFSIISIAFPVLQNLLLSNSLFKREIIFSDIIGGILLHCITAFLGAFLGAVAHPRIIKDRKLAILVPLSVALIGYTSGALKLHIPAEKFILGLFPPVYRVLESFNGCEYFSIKNMIFSLCYGGVYCMALALVQLLLLKKMKF